MKRPKTDESPSQVAFDYLKSSHFRVVRADGAIGGVTPGGQIHFALFSERPSIPRRVVYQLGADGKPGDVIEELTESRRSIVRELDVDVFVSIEVAERLNIWLDGVIKEAKAKTVSRQKEQ